MAKVLVIYHSQQSGNTEECAKSLAKGLDQVPGIEYEMINTNVAQRVDMATFEACDAVAIGSPDYFSYVAGTIKQLFDDLLTGHREGMNVRNKPCALFMTHGGGGRAIGPFSQLAKEYDLVDEPFVCLRSPGEGCEELITLGRKLGEAAAK